MLTQSRTEIAEFGFGVFRKATLIRMYGPTPDNVDDICVVVDVDGGGAPDNLRSIANRSALSLTTMMLGRLRCTGGTYGVSLEWCLSDANIYRIDLRQENIVNHLSPVSALDRCNQLSWNTVNDTDLRNVFSSLVVEEQHHLPYVLCVETQEC